VGRGRCSCRNHDREVRTRIRRQSAQSTEGEIVTLAEHLRPADRQFVLLAAKPVLGE
jgi:hypothetical protein